MERMTPMLDAQVWNFQRAAGFLFVLSAFATFPGFMMFWLRRGHKGGEPRSRAHWIVERCSILSGVVFIAIGFMLLEIAFQNTDGFMLANIGATAYFFGGVLVVAAEALMLTLGYEKVISLVNIYVVMAFIAEAIIGGALIQSGLLAVAIGWATILWNIAWLIMLPIISRRDIYYPILHYVMPLMIGIALLLK
jgi:hypothetical protein